MVMPHTQHDKSASDTRETLESATICEGPGRHGLLRRALRYAVILQFCMLVLSALVLDGGDTLRLCCVSILLAWVPIVAIVWRRQFTSHGEIGRLDLAIVRHVFWVFFVGMLVAYHSHLLPQRWYLGNRLHDANPAIQKESQPIR